MRNNYSLSQVSFLILFEVNTHELKFKMIDFPYFIKNKKRSVVKQSIEGFQNFLVDLIEYTKTVKRI